MVHGPRGQVFPPECFSLLIAARIKVGGRTHRASARPQLHRAGVLLPARGARTPAVVVASGLVFGGLDTAHHVGAPQFSPAPAQEAPHGVASQFSHSYKLVSRIRF